MFRGTKKAPAYNERHLAAAKALGKLPANAVVMCKSGALKWSKKWKREQEPPARSSSVAPRAEQPALRASSTAAPAPDSSSDMVRLPCDVLIIVVVATKVADESAPLIHLPSLSPKDAERGEVVVGRGDGRARRRHSECEQTGRCPMVSSNSFPPIHSPGGPSRHHTARTFRAASSLSASSC